MQNIKKTLKSKRFWLGTVLPFALAVAAAFVARYQLEISDGATANYMAGQWPVYAPLNALTAFCLTLVVFALCGSFCTFEMVHIRLHAVGITSPLKIHIVSNKLVFSLILTDDPGLPA